MNWLASTIGKRGYVADYLRTASGVGARVIGTGNETNTIGFMACDAAYRVSAISAPEYVNEVHEICISEQINAIVTFSDIDVRVLSRHKERFVEAGIACFFPDSITAEMFGDKWRSYEAFIDAGFETPQSWLTIESVDHSFSDGPLVVKPRDGSASQGYSVVEDRQQLENAFNAIDRPLIQTFTAGRLVNVEVCSSVAGGTPATELHTSTLTSLPAVKV